MAEIKKRCYKYLDLSVRDKIDYYDYHDAPASIEFSCDLEDGHEGMHSEDVNGDRIYWEN